MPKDSIALIPENGFNQEQKQSNEAILWLKFISEKYNLPIQHAKNGGEFRIKNFLMDGFCE
jgi:hypothetical protein